jgi:hypothetical protein
MADGFTRVLEHAQTNRKHRHSGPTRLHVTTPDRVCTSGKECLTRGQADVRADRMMDAGEVQPGCHVMAYECKQCHCWHVGNKFIVFPKE